MHPPKTHKQVCAFLSLVGYYRKFIKNVTKIVKPLTILTHQQGKLNCTPAHHKAFLLLKESITLAPILHYPGPNRRYIVYQCINNTYGAQLSQEHDHMEFPIAFLSHTFSDTQR